jgi:hypothetical protein
MVGNVVVSPGPLLMVGNVVVSPGPLLMVCNVVVSLQVWCVWGLY